MLSFRDFLLESPSTYPLAVKFARFNRELFNSEIPSDVPVVFKALLKSKKFMGMTTYALVGRRYEPGTLEIFIDHTMDYPEKILDETLIHEMIHAWLAATNNNDMDPRGGILSHGPTFLAKAKEFSERTGLDIKVTDNAYIHDLPAKSKLPVYYMILCGNNMLYVVSAKMFNERGDEIKEFINDRVGKKIHMVYKGKSIRFRPSVKTTPQGYLTYDYFRLSPDDLQHLKNDKNIEVVEG